MMEDFIEGTALIADVFAACGIMDALQSRELFCKNAQSIFLLCAAWRLLYTFQHLLCLKLC